MCTAYSHYIKEHGNCLCGAVQGGRYDPERDFLRAAVETNQDVELSRDGEDDEENE